MTESKSVRVTFMGGASMTWVPSFAYDFLNSSKLAGSTLVLMDPDGARLQTMQKYLQRMVREHRGDLTIEITTERARALAGADYVVATFGPGGHEYWKQDIGIALRYGIQEPAGMSVGQGGLMQGLKGIPMIVEIAHDMEKLCPGARLFNYTNPMSSLMLAVNRYSRVQGVGVCPGIYLYIGRIARTLGLPANELAFMAGGVNHLNWVLEVRHNGEDILPKYGALLAAAEQHHRARKIETLHGREAVETHERFEPISRKLYELYGAWPTPGDGHVAEFVPFFIGKGRDIETRYNLPHDYIEKRIEKRKVIWAQIEAAAAGKGDILQGEYESQERAEQMVQSIEFNEQRVF